MGFELNFQILFKVPNKKKASNDGWNYPSFEEPHENYKWEVIITRHINQSILFGLELSTGFPLGIFDFDL